ncbi:ATP-binding cassette domain-containing protein [uncultured Bifidobacterium sp.]|uniref:ATP-binding cassette domain-containing protein n=1 Tax=uncultured Bifidobacterium sp. TaxID=165187 RepID=UPI00344F0FF8
METQDLTKQIGHGSLPPLAVNEVDLHIGQGQVYGLPGPDGVGQSTARTTGRHAPSRKWSHPSLMDTSGPATTCTISVLIENQPLHPDLTVAENLNVRATLFGLPQSRVDDVLQVVHLTETGRKRMNRSSMGMKQRPGIASALLTHHKLLILDKPATCAL